MSSAASIWTEQEQRAWALPEKLRPVEWANRHRILDSMFSAAPGRYRSDRTPYTDEPLNCFDDPFVERVTVIKGSQTGFTEMLMNGVGWSIDMDPGPLLYVVPTEDDATGLHGARLKSLIDTTPAVSKHRTRHLNDLRGTLWQLDNMLVRLAWPTPGKLASMPAKRVIFDEVDKFPKFTGKEANPLLLGDKRLDTYRDEGAQRWIVSTPVGEDDHANNQFLLSDQRRFWVPCPHCGEYQVPVWAQVRFPKEVRDPEEIKAKCLAWYECVHCEQRIENRYKARMLSRGRWCPDACTVRPDGSLVGHVPSTTHRGYHFPSIFSPWVDFWTLAAEWIEAQGRPDKLQDFYNSRLAEPWVERIAATSAQEVRTRQLPYEPGTVHPEAAFVVGSIDVQKTHVWYSFRAFGAGETNWLVEYGRVERHITPRIGEVQEDPWRDVVARVLEAEFPRADTGELVKPRLIAIDSGHFTDEVYAFAARFPDRLVPIKGANSPMPSAPYRMAEIERTRKGKKRPRGVVLWWVDPFYYKPKLHRMMQSEPGVPGCAYVYEGCPDEYVEQVTAEEKVTIRNRTTGRARVEWRLKKGRKANHLGDCENYNLFLAELLGAPRLTADDVARARTARRRAAAQEEAAKAPKTQAREGWLGGGRPGGWFQR